MRKDYVRYAYRLETKRIKESDFPYNPAIQMADPESVIEFAKSLEDSDIEKFIVLYLNGQNKLIGIHVVPGTTGSAVVYPREVIKHALLSGAVAMILVHNHPSGNTHASNDDKELTKKIVEAASLFEIRIHDHVILASGHGVSFREKGWISF
ncbi:MAG: DNA repair protein RadC [Syntrophales bacterium]|nr:DNA repair protein RadC [Syntrophales bacterium]